MTDLGDTTSASRMPEQRTMACFSQVKGTHGVQALLSWPAEVSVWGDESYDNPLFTGGLPCAEGHSQCTALSAGSNRPSDALMRNEKVDGTLTPDKHQPATFSAAPLGPGIYGLSLLPEKSSNKQEFGVTVSSEVLKCSPGFIPVYNKTCDGEAAGSVMWKGPTSTQCADCVRPAKLTLNQPTKVCYSTLCLLLTAHTFESWHAIAKPHIHTEVVKMLKLCGVQGLVMEGNGGAAYFQFQLPPGVSSVTLIAQVLASDDPGNSIDFYATRNTLWTKDVPERDDLDASHILPIFKKDADTSAQLVDYEVSNTVVCSFCKSASVLTRYLCPIYLHMRMCS